MSDAPADVCARLLRIHGRVQGVGYRDWLRGEATARGLAGWVRNRRDGTVEALAVGRAETVAALVDSCYAGPSLAAVEKVELSHAEVPEALHGFERRPTL